MGKITELTVGDHTTCFDEVLVTEIEEQQEPSRYSNQPGTLLLREESVNDEYVPPMTSQQLSKMRNEEIISSDRSHQKANDGDGECIKNKVGGSGSTRKLSQIAG